MTAAEAFKTVATFCVVFILIGLWFHFRSEAEWAIWMISIAAGLIALSLLSSSIALILAKAWMGLGKALGWVNSRIILSVVFLFVLTPVSLVYRLVKGDTLQLRRNPGKSYFSKRKHPYRFEDLQNPW